MTIGPIEFDQPQWLWLAPALWVVVWVLARRSLSGLGRKTRFVALVARAVVIALLVGALAEPSLRDESKDVASVVVMDVSRSVPANRVSEARNYISEAVQGATETERLGVISAAIESYVQSLPSPRTRQVDVIHTGGDDGTDLASGVRLALAIAPEDAATRILLVTDGNETSGSLLQAAEAAKAAGVPVDVMPIRYDFDREVFFDRLVAPPTARQGETVAVRLILQATRPTSGRINLLVNGRPVDLDPETELLSAPVELDEGVNVRSVPVRIPAAGAQRFEAFFEPDDASADSIAENNSASAVTFVSTEGRVLVYAGDPAAAGDIASALTSGELDVEVRTPASAHESLEELASYDAVVMVDVSADMLSARQVEELRTYVHDVGGGLVMVGGPNSYGAGGWIGSALADALPVKLDPPQKRELPRGALVLIMHSCEMPNGNYWGQQTALAAVKTLTREDLVGVLEYTYQFGTSGWTYPIQKAGDKSGVTRAINNLQFGDMPDFTSSMTQALNGLKGVNAGRKHVIIISDGDPSGGDNNAFLQQYVDAGISMSTVAVFPHGGSNADLAKMARIAALTGGNSYQITQQSQVASLPQIFINEARTVKRALIWEGDPFVPNRVDVAAESLRGMGSLPPISGYVVTADREGLSQVLLRGPEDDPILAEWQYGLGRAVAYTSDGAARWNSAWMGWPQYRAFWLQQTRWAMRPSGSANVSVTTQPQGDETLVIVDALNSTGDRMNFARFDGRVVTPGLGSESIELRQTGPGRYEGTFRSADPGSYVVNLRYEAPGPGGQGVERGGVQAAVIKPIADERRALTDNSALLQQVADLTGGRVLNPDPRQAELFSREGLRMPISLSPIWLLVAVLGVTTFLADVAIRRVRFDIPAMYRAVRKAMGARRATSEAQIGALKAARERTREQMKAEEPASGKAKPKETASVKFEAAAGATPAAGPITEGQRASAPKPTAPTQKADEKKAKGEPEEEGMSRLLRAKKRARDEMQDDKDKD